MARGTTLRQLISDLRDELRRANSPAASPDDTASLRATINHVIAVIYAANDWPFLQCVYPKIKMNAGQRYYDMPEGMNPDRVLKSIVYWSGDPHPIERGIDFSDYAGYDPEDNERTSPICKWDVRFTGERDQVEVWPLPDDTEQYLRFEGIQKVKRLVADDDICPLDDTLVVLYAAAELAPNDSADKDAKQALARELLRQLKVRAVSGGEKRYQMGLGTSSKETNLRARSTVRIGR